MRRLHLVAVLDVKDVEDLGFRRPVHPPDLRGFQPAVEEHADFEELLLRAHEEVARLPREHDRLVRGVDPLIAEGRGGFAQPLPGVPEILREVRGQRPFGRGPAVVRLAFLDPLFAVITLVARASRHFSRPDYQMTRTAPDARMAASRVRSARSSVRAAATIERIERIATESQLVGEIQLLRSQVERLIGRVAEEIAEKPAEWPAKVDPSRAREQPTSHTTAIGM